MPWRGSSVTLGDGEGESSATPGVGRLAKIGEKNSSLGLQIPSKKVLKPLKTPQSIFLEGVWSPRGLHFGVWGCVKFLFVHLWPRPRLFLLLFNGIGRISSA